VAAAVSVIQDFAGQATAAAVDLLLFPECFLQGYLVTERHVHHHGFDVGSQNFAAVLAKLAGIRPTLVLGMIERWGGAHYNTALVITAGRRRWTMRWKAPLNAFQIAFEGRLTPAAH
jgi:predicted amidohydrolase